MMLMLAMAAVTVMSAIRATAVLESMIVGIVAIVKPSMAVAVTMIIVVLLFDQERVQWLIVSHFLGGGYICWKCCEHNTHYNGARDVSQLATANE